MEITVTYTEDIKLDLKQVFILQEMNQLGEISWGWSRYDYLHSTYHDKTRDLSDNFWDLARKKLVEKCDDGSEWSYIKYRISEKGQSIFPQIKDINTEELHHLRPKK